MGEIADGLIDGTFDSITGEYLGEGPGYPRSLEWRDRHQGKQGDSRTGLKNYLNTRTNIPHSKWHEFCLKACEHIKQKEYKGGKSWKGVSDIIQDNWGEFIKYVQKKQVKMTFIKN